MKMKGTVRAGDAVVSTLMVSPSYSSPAGYNVTPSTQITRNGLPATLADLEVGQRAEAKYDRNTLVAVKIEIKATWR
jgi:hypothetical protein